MQAKHPLFTVAELPAPLSAINTTPLIDVMLVLLIMVIITIPLATHSVNIDLPGGPGSVQRDSVALYIDYDSSLYWNDTLVADMNELQSHLRWVAQQSEQPNLIVRANKRVKYDTVAQVLAAAQRTGVRYLGFAGQQEFVEQ